MHRYIYIANTEDNFAYDEDSSDTLEDNVNDTCNIHHIILFTLFYLPHGQKTRRAVAATSVA